MTKTPRSRWTVAFHEAYGQGAPYDVPLFSRLFKLPRKVLETVEDRGFAAAGKRANGYGWARARVHKFLLVHVRRHPLEAKDADADLHEVAWKDMAKKLRITQHGSR